MGHDLAFIDLTPEHAKSAHFLAEQPDPFRVRTFASEMVGMAVQKWRDEEANRWDNERAGHGQLVEVLPEGLVHPYIAAHHDDAVQWSLVVPFASDDDVEVKKVKVKLPATASMVASAHAALRHAERYQQPALVDHVVLTELRKAYPNAVKAVVVSAPARRKPVSKATEGTAVNVYEVFLTGGRPGAGSLATAGTLAEARNAALVYMEAHPDVQDLEVRGRVVRMADGDASSNLLSISRPVSENSTITVEVELHTVSAGATPAGYTVVFDFHC